MTTIHYVPKEKGSSVIIQDKTYCDYCGSGFTLPIDAERHEIKCSSEWRKVNG